MHAGLLERVRREPFLLADHPDLVDQHGRPITRNRELGRLSQIADWVDAHMSSASENPVTPVNISAAGTANSSGNAAFAFEPIPNGLALEGTCTVIGSPVGAQWTLTANGVNLGQWTGTSTGGPFIIAGPSSPELTGTNLTSGAEVTATFVGNQGPPSQFSSYPQPLSGSVSISALGVGVVLLALQSVPFTSLIPVALQPTTRTLLLNIQTDNGLYNVEVLGGTSNYAYYLQAPYLAGLGTFNNLVVVPVNPTLDPVVYVRLLTNTGSTTATMEAVGDTAQYPEDIFYNGTLESTEQILTLGSTAPGALVDGPCRVLAVAIGVLSTAAAAFAGAWLINSGTPPAFLQKNMLRVDAYGQAGANAQRSYSGNGGYGIILTNQASIGQAGYGTGDSLAYADTAYP